MHPQRFLSQTLYFSSVASLLVMGNHGAFAQIAYEPPGSSGRPTGPHVPGGSSIELRGYNPPPDLQRPREEHTGGGVRGCGDDVAAIAPRITSVGQTVSTTPTFVWYNFSDDSDPIEFQLYRFEADGSFDSIAVEQFEASSPGYMAYTLPPEVADLEVGETYLWEVVLYCDEEFEEPGQYTSAEIEVVESPSTLAVESGESAIARAKAYAASGFWYDALAAVYDATSSEAVAFRRDLLLDLADLEAQLDTDDSLSISEQLRQIAAMEP